MPAIATTLKTIAMSHLQWADALLEAGLGGAAIRELEHAATLLRAHGGHNLGTLGRVETSLALALRRHGAAERSVSHYQAAIEIERRLDDLEGLYQCTNGLAAAYAEIGRWDLARPQFDAAVAVARRLGTPRLMNEAMNAAGWAALARHRPAAALPLLQRASDGPLDPWTAPYTFTNLATAYRQLRRPREAMTAVERALELSRSREMSDAEAQALLERAQVSDLLGQHEQALTDAREVLAILERVRAKLSPVDFLRRGFGDIHEHAYDVVISLLQRRNRTEEALAAAEQSRARAFADLLAARALGRSTGEEQIPLLGEAPPTLENTPAAPSVTTDPVATGVTNALTPSDLAALAARLHSVIVEYWIGEAASVAWVISSTGRVHAQLLGVTPSRLSAHVDETAADPLLGRPAGSESVSNALHAARGAHRAVAAAQWRTPHDHSARGTVPAVVRRAPGRSAASTWSSAMRSTTRPEARFFGWRNGERRGSRRGRDRICSSRIPRRYRSFPTSARCRIFQEQGPKWPASLGP